MSRDTPHLRLRKYLNERPVRPSWPEGITPMLLEAIEPRLAHTVLTQSFPGLIARLEDWYGNLTSDSEYDPALCVAAVTAEGSVIGFVQSWTSDFIKDLAVLPSARHKGIGEALMRHTFLLFAARGAAHVDLKVQTDELGARRLYARLGMVEVA